LERDDILAEKTSFRANEKLLSVLSRKSPQQFKLFLHALDKCGQSHVRNVIADQTDQIHLYLPGKSEKEGDTAVSSLNINRFWKFFHSRLNCKSVTKLLLWIPPHSKRLALIPTLLSYHLSTLPLYHFNNLTLCNNLFTQHNTQPSAQHIVNCTVSIPSRLHAVQLVIETSEVDQKLNGHFSVTASLLYF